MSKLGPNNIPSFIFPIICFILAITVFVLFLLVNNYNFGISDAPDVTFA